MGFFSGKSEAELVKILLVKINDVIELTTAFVQFKPWTNECKRGTLSDCGRTFQLLKGKYSRSVRSFGKLVKSNSKYEDARELFLSSVGQFIEEMEGVMKRSNNSWLSSKQQINYTKQASDVRRDISVVINRLGLGSKVARQLIKANPDVKMKKVVDIGKFDPPDRKRFWG